MKLIFEWDAVKARKNMAKHKVSFEEARTLLSDPLLLTVIDDYHSKGEGRFISVGRSMRGRILLLIHTERHETEESLVIRIISCRKATKSERKTYEENQS
jgi:uncharacterized DUF497 family protein